MLEVGCGTGRWVEPLRRAGGLVVGVDASMGMLAQARGLADLVYARANMLPFRAGSFDVIYTVNAIHHFHDARAFIKDAAMLLKPGGCWRRSASILGRFGGDIRTITLKARSS